MLAISSGLPMRPNASRPKPSSLMMSSSTDVGLPMIVLTPPGWMELTRMPNRPSSREAVFVIPLMANLLAEYDRSPFLEPTPSMEEMLMIDPPPASRMGAMAERMPRKHPTWLTLMTFM